VVQVHSQTHLPAQQVRYTPTDVGHTFTKTTNQEMGESTQPISTDSSNTTNVELVKRLIAERLDHLWSVLGAKRGR
jgi:hypothetical protein